MKLNRHTDERAVLVMARMSSFPVQTRGIESESWLNIVVNLKAMHNVNVLNDFKYEI